VLRAATEAFRNGLQIAAGTTRRVIAAVAILPAVLVRGRSDRAAKAAPLRAGSVVIQGVLCAVG
jgi:hypothetical protein